MKEIASTINGHKSRIEGLERLVQMRKNFDEWVGKDLVDESSILIHEGEAWRVMDSGYAKQVGVARQLLKMRQRWSVSTYEGHEFIFNARHLEKDLMSDK